jgi:hypothetical protein
MPNDTETTHYNVRGTDPTNNEQITFECVGLGVCQCEGRRVANGWL